MKSTRLSFFFNSSLTLALLVTAADLTYSQDGGTPKKKSDKPQQKQKGFGKQKPPERPGSMEKIVVHGKSLEGNLEGDSPDRDVFVYLPPSYGGNGNQRYPVVYLLHGYGLTGERWMTFANLAATADKDIAAGTMKEMILVNPDAFTKFNGSMY